MSVHLAKINDSKEIFMLVNKAYEIEKTHPKMTFKRENRYITQEEVIEHIRQYPYYIYLINNKIVGCIRIYTTNNNTITNYGPFAIDSNYQKQGIGEKLLNYIYKWSLDII